MTADFDLAQRIRTVVRIDPSANALKFKQRWFTWGEMARLMEALDELFSRADVPQAAPVGILLRNNPANICALLEVLASRRCVITLNPFQSPEKILADFRQADVSAILADETDWAAVPELAAAAKASGCLAVSMSNHDLSARCHPQVPLAPVAGKHSQDNIAILMQSSGTTGPAKRIPLPFDKFENALMSAAAYESKGDPSATPTLKTTPAMLITPLVHIGGMYFTLAAAVVGRPIVIFEKFNAQDWANGVYEHQISVTALPPTALQMILDADIEKEKLASLKIIRAGSAPMSPELQDRFEATYNIPVLDSYGATEFAGAVAGWSLKDHQQYRHSKQGSVGRAQPGNELRVVDPETGIPVANGRIGLLEVRSAQMDSSRWVRTSDLSELDDDGFLYIRGRADSAIIRGGFKIIPADVEAVLKQHPAIKEACVVGIPDSRLGAVPAAAVMVDPDVQCSEAELLAHLKKQLVAYQVPAQLLIVDALPRTPSMKICQPDVIALFKETRHV